MMNLIRIYVFYSQFLFANKTIGNLKEDNDASSTVSSAASITGSVENMNMDVGKSSDVCRFQDSNMTLLDLYSGCGAMSTGLCFGASMSGLNITTVS